MAIWDEAHLHEPKQKSAKCIWEENKMQTAEKDTQNNKGGHWGGGFLPFLFADKGVKCKNV